MLQRKKKITVKCRPWNLPPGITGETMIAVAKLFSRAYLNRPLNRKKADRFTTASVQFHHKRKGEGVH